MLTNIIILDTDAPNMEEVLLQTEKCAIYEGLSEKDTLRLRLLAEETVGMVKAILGEFDAKFWIGAENKCFSLHLVARANVSEEEREQLLKASTSGKNKATDGFLGKVRRLFEISLFGANDAASAAALSPADLYDLEGTYIFSEAWSLEEARNDENYKWDELERSIIAGIADNVQVGVRCHQAELIVTKQF